MIDSVSAVSGTMTWTWSSLARGSGPDAPDADAAAADDDTFRSKAHAWLRDLEGVGAEAHVDGSGEVHRASARPPLAPRGLGRDVRPRSCRSLVSFVR